MSVGVVTVAVGDTYQNQLPEWCEAVSDLYRPADQVTIVVDDIPDRLVDELLNILPNLQIVHSPIRWTNNPQILANDAIACTHTEWICRMDADDRIYPHALNPVDLAVSDVFMFGIRTSRGQELYPKHLTSEQITRSPHNFVFAGSPYRRKVWETVGGYKDLLYEDWLFWRESAQRGYLFQASGSIDYEYVIGDHNLTSRINHRHASYEVLSHVH